MSDSSGRSRYPETLPVISALGWTRVTGGWAVVSLEIQGGQVLDREVLSPGPETADAAQQRISTEAVSRFQNSRAARRKKQ
jgi:hypothetical protein